MKALRREAPPHLQVYCSVLMPRAVVTSTCQNLTSARDRSHHPGSRRASVLPSHTPRGSELIFGALWSPEDKAPALASPVILSLTAAGVTSTCATPVQPPYPSWSFIWNCLKGARGSRRSWGRGRGPRSTAPWFSEDCGEHI